MTIPGAPMAAVLTTVDDFESQVLIGKNDVELIPKRLRAKGTADSELMAGLAEAGDEDHRAGAGAAPATRP